MDINEKAMMLAYIRQLESELSESNGLREQALKETAKAKELAIEVASTASGRLAGMGDMLTEQTQLQQALANRYGEVVEQNKMLQGTIRDMRQTIQSLHRQRNEAASKLDEESVLMANSHHLRKSAFDLLSALAPVDAKLSTRLPNKAHVLSIGEIQAVEILAASAALRAIISKSSPSSQTTDSLPCSCLANEACSNCKDTPTP